MKSTAPRVAVVVTHPIQHFCPLYRAVTGDGRVSLRVFFASRAGAVDFFDEWFQTRLRWQGNLLSGFDHEFLPGSTAEPPGTKSLDNAAVADRLRAFDPDAVVIYGFWHRISRRALRWARQARRPVLLITDGELRQPRSLVSKCRKAILLPPLFSRVDGFLTVGDCNEAYYARYGASPARFFRSPFPIDEDHLKSALQTRDVRRARVRAELGIPADAVVAAAVGKFIERKGHVHLIEAVASIKRQFSKAPHVVLAGDGPLRGVLEELVRNQAAGLVHFAGFVPVERIPDYLVASDVLVHPSAQDPHPLAISEAIACGLPLIVSDRIGSVGPTDDARVGENALEFPYGDVDRLATALHQLASDAAVRRSMAAASARIASARGMQASVDGFVRAVMTVTGLGAMESIAV